jgi:hypothetical protein
MHIEVSVFDTYVRKEDGSLMHFDIIVPAGTNEADVFRFGKDYLKQKGVSGLVSSRECRFCHIEFLQEHMEKSISEEGYFIVEMQGC